MSGAAFSKVIVGGTTYHIRGTILKDMIGDNMSWNLTTIPPSNSLRNTATLIDLGNKENFRLILVDNHMRQNVITYNKKDVTFLE